MRKIKVLHSTANKIITRYETECNELLEFMRLKPWTSKKRLVALGFNKRLVEAKYMINLRKLKREV